MWGADDPDDRKPMIWEDLTYENERSHPITGRTRTDDVVEFDKSLFDCYKMLVRTRKENVALRRGGFTSLLTDDANNTFAFKRSTWESEAVVVINNSDRAQTVQLELPGSWAYRDESTGKLIEGSEHLRYGLAARRGAILIRKK
jgi:glycosidase